MHNRPPYVVTLLFTDIEGSTQLWEQYPERMAVALARHDVILRGAIEAHGGHVFKTVGDAFHTVFTDASSALVAALAGQRGLAAESWDVPGPLRVRMALYTGVVEARDGDYYGPSLSRAARLVSAAWGGQTLLAFSTAQEVWQALPAGAALRDLGQHRLKDLATPEQIFQLLTADLQSDFPALKTLTMSTRSRRNRSRMIEKVQAVWIDGVLHQSLHGVAAVELDLSYQSEQVEHPWQLLVQHGDGHARVVPGGTRMVDLFRRCDGAMLILGAPGSGKTTLLLQLADALLAEARHDDSLPLPVVFNLSAWAERRRPLAEWLIDELNIRYDVPRTFGREWLTGDGILPLLDGLDEVRQDYRTACVAAINAFRREHGQINLAVCCRVADYANLPVHLRLQDAVMIEPLTAEQIGAYLDRVGSTLKGLRQALVQDAELRELARVPLTLNIMTLAYSGLDELPPVTGMPERTTSAHALLFDAYVKRMFQRRGVEEDYVPAQTVRWLSWLARSLRREGQTVFFIERLQPDWLSSQRERRVYVLLDRLGWGIIVGLVLGLLHAFLFGVARGLIFGWQHWLQYGPRNVLVFGVSAALFAGLLGGARTREAGPHGRGRNPASSAVWGMLVVAVLYAFAYRLVLPSPLGPSLERGLEAGIISWLAGGPDVQPRYIVLVETVRWSRSQLRRAMVAGLGTGLVALTATLLVGRGVWVDALINGLIGLGAGGLAGGLVVRDIETHASPNQGIWRSGANAIRVGSTFGLVAGLIAWLGIRSGSPLYAMAATAVYDTLTIGLGLALAFGGYAFLSHWALRLVLWRSGSIPWNYARFLDHAHERIFLHKVGGGYIFVHRLLLDYFASFPGEQSCPCSTLDSQPEDLQLRRV